MNRIRASILIVLALLAPFLGGVSATTVLCIERDGRVAVESISSVCCENRAPFSLVTQSPVPQELISSSIERAGDCDSCLDIPLSFSHATRVVKRAELTFGFMCEQGASESAHLSLNKSIRSERFAFSRFATNFSTPFVRSAVLRI